MFYCSQKKYQRSRKPCSHDWRKRRMNHEFFNRSIPLQTNDQRCESRRRRRESYLIPIRRTTKLRSSKRSWKMGQSFWRNCCRHHSPSRDDSAWWRDKAASVPLFVWDRNDLLFQDGHRADAVHQEHGKVESWGRSLASSLRWLHLGRSCHFVLRRTRGKQSRRFELLDRWMQSHGTTRREDKTLVDHTECSETSSVNGTESIVPVIRWMGPWGMASNRTRRTFVGIARTTVLETNGGPKILWKRNQKRENGRSPVRVSVGSSRRRSICGCGEQSVRILEIDKAISAEEDEALRFALNKSEALIVDNYRMLHAREAFHGLEKPSHVESLELDKRFHWATPTGYRLCWKQIRCSQQHSWCSKVNPGLFPTAKVLIVVVLCSLQVVLSHPELVHCNRTAEVGAVSTAFAPFLLASLHHPPPRRCPNSGL